MYGSVLDLAAVIYLPDEQLSLLPTNTAGFVKTGFHPASQ